MNALEIYEAAFDSAANVQEAIKDFGGDVSAYIKAYADGAFNLSVSDDVANKIAKCSENYASYTGKQWEHAYYEFVQKVLEDIEL